jgi:hypothetical protein
MTYRVCYSHINNSVRTRWATLRSIIFFRDDINPYMDVDVHGLGRRIYRVTDNDLAQHALETLASGDTIILFIRNQNMNADVISYELMLPNPEKSRDDRWLDIAYSKARSGKLAGLMDMPSVDQWISSGDVVH